MQNDNIVSGWRSGADSINGLENPAGPLFTEGAEAMEAAMTKPSRANAVLSYTAVTCSSPLHTCYCN